MTRAVATVPTATAMEGATQVASRTSAAVVATPAAAMGGVAVFTACTNVALTIRGATVVQSQHAGMRQPWRLEQRRRWEVRRRS
jgi:hypothetical protein